MENMENNGTGEIGLGTPTPAKGIRRILRIIASLCSITALPQFTIMILAKEQRMHR